MARVGSMSGSRPPQRNPVRRCSASWSCGTANPGAVASSASLTGSGGDGTDVRGTDASAAAVEWCRRNLAFARFETNGLAPPLPYGDAGFDLVYALSVFTHLTVELQQAWLRELRRVLRTDGLLIVTTHGAAYRGRLFEEERKQGYDRGMGW